MENEYGFARMFVLTNTDYILKELSKARTVMSIWKEMVRDKNINIPYRTFLYNINSQITDNHSINVHIRNIQNQKKNVSSENKRNESKSNKFQFSTKIDNEDMI